MPQKQAAADLSTLGDFVLANENGQPTVSLVTAFYVGNQQHNHEWLPKIEKLPVSQAIEKLASLQKHYEQVASARFSLQVTTTAQDNARQFKSAKQQLTGLKPA